MKKIFGALLLFGLITAPMQTANAAVPLNCDTSNQDLTGCDFSGRDFFNGLLDNKNFTDTNLTSFYSRFSYWVNVNFTRANATNATFYYAYMADSNFNSANLTGVKFTGANLSRADFTDATLDGVVSGGITGEPVNLPTGWKLTRGYLVGPGANLESADLSGADLDGVSLVGANLNGVRSGGITGEVTLPEGWILQGGYLIGPGADLSYAKLDGLAIWEADFTNVNLYGASIQGAAFIYPKSLSGLKSGNISGQTHYGLPAIHGYIIAPNVDLSNANLQGVDLSGISMAGANLHGADFSGANLTDANLTDTNLVNTDFTDANLTNTNMDSSTFLNTKFNGATMTDTKLTASEIRYAEFYGSKFLRTNFIFSTLIEPKSQSVTGNLFSTGSIQLMNGVLKNAFVTSFMPYLEGTAKPLEVLTLKNSFDLPEFTEMSIKWYRNDVALAEDNALTYETLPSDVGAKIKAVVTYSKPGYIERTDVTSERLIEARVMEVGSVTIAGTVKIGKKVTAKATPWTPGAKLAYKWLRNGKAIKGATKSTYKVLAADKGKQLSVQITQSAAGYATASKTSTSVKVK